MVYVHYKVQYTPYKMHNMIHIIDDDRDILTILQMFFSKKGFDVVADYNGEGLNLTGKAFEGVYLIDINLIGKNGVELCKLIKKAGQRIPVILMSANSDLELLAKDCAADAFVAKPFDMQKILLTVNKLVA